MKKKKIRLERPKKQYALDQCALYGVKGIEQALRIIGLEGASNDALRRLSSADSYIVWSNGDRIVQQSKEHLQHIQRRIATLLRRVTPPNYRHSGIRNRSFRTNAAAHVNSLPCIQFDIRKFYPSTTYSHVRRFFADDMNCAADVASLLAGLCCYDNQHLPTGGVHSEVLAFYAHKSLFDLVDQRVRQRGGTLTIYVDDGTISMQNASATDLRWIKTKFQQQGLTLHKRKSFVVSARKPKTITGVVVVDGDIRPPNSQLLQIVGLHRDLAAEDNQETQRTKARQLLGHLDHVAQIDPRHASKATGNRTRLKALLKTT
jgi:RNA-directed DNA polymerase